MKESKVVQVAIKLAESNSREILAMVERADTDGIRELLYKAYHLACKEEFKKSLRKSYKRNVQSSTSQ